MFIYKAKTLFKIKIYHLKFKIFMIIQQTHLRKLYFKLQSVILKISDYS